MSIANNAPQKVVQILLSRMKSAYCALFEL